MVATAMGLAFVGTLTPPAALATLFDRCPGSLGWSLGRRGHKATLGTCKKLIRRCSLLCNLLCLRSAKPDNLLRRRIWGARRRMSASNRTIGSKRVLGEIKRAGHCFVYSPENKITQCCGSMQGLISWGL